MEKKRQHVFGGFLSEDDGSDSCTVTVIATGLQAEDSMLQRHTTYASTVGSSYDSNRNRTIQTPQSRPTIQPITRKPLRDDSKIVKRDSEKISVPTFVKKTNREE